MNVPHGTDPTTGTVVIIGAGHAGIAFAANLRQRAFDGRIIVFSAERDMPYPVSYTHLTLPTTPYV